MNISKTQSNITQLFFMIVLSCFTVLYPISAQSDDYSLKDYTDEVLKPSRIEYDDNLNDFGQSKTKSPFEDRVIDEPFSSQTFHGYPCTQDCSGHKAGYAWAKKKNIESRDGCGGNSNSFREGCYAFVKEGGGY